MEGESQPTHERPRILAIDALRGFDMFWITGGQGIALGLAALLCGGTAPEWVRYELEHPEWTGFTAWDMIMPTFLFLAGASMPFSLGVERERGVPLGHIFLRIARRVALLWILGMIAQGNLLSSIVWTENGAVRFFDFSHLRLYSNTLQSIASGYVLASVGVLFLSVRGQAVLCGGLLVLYWLLLRFVPFDGHAAGTLEPQNNLALYLDHLILGRFRDGTAYTWILSSLAFGGSVLLGCFAGHVLKSKTMAAQRKLAALVALAAGCLLGGQLWSFDFPIIKHIWTSSMVLWAGGWSFAALAMFYGLIDIGGYRRWAQIFVVVGANAILAYMLGEVWVDTVEGLVEWGFGSEIPVVQGLASLFAFLSMWLFLRVLYRKRIFIRV